MTNTSHYPSLELTKKLKKIGMVINSLYGYGYGECQLLGNNHEPEFSSKQYFYDTNKSLDWIFIECPSVMEMLDVIKGTGYELCINEQRSYISLFVVDKESKRTCKSNTFSGTIPNALANMILWLVENNYISFNK